MLYYENDRRDEVELLTPVNIFPVFFLIFFIYYLLKKNWHGILFMYLTFFFFFSNFHKS